MNIFVLDNDPVKAARYCADTHVVKMPLETAQMLCTVLWKHGIEAKYRPTHQSHKCVVWAQASSQNFEWLVIHGLSLCDEYTRRYGRKHACEKVIIDCWLRQPALSNIGLTKFAQALPDYLKSEDPVLAYRNYYRFEKKHLASWKRNDIPEWFYPSSSRS